MKSKYLVTTLLTAIIFSAILFLFAGRTSYWQGWLFLLINLAGAFLNFWFIRNDPSLMQERSKMREGVKPWDRTILALSVLCYIAILIIAGLDSGRFEWTTHLHWSIYTFGVLLSLVGQLIFLTARKENRFFSSVVRIQKDRSHTVCDTGLYKVVRHPGYLGMMLSLLAIPLITGSLWSFIPVAFSSVLLLIRTILEDQTLLQELDGYAAYAEKVKRKLIPKVW